MESGADCVGQQPSWASVTFGAVLCSHAAGAVDIVVERRLTPDRAIPTIGNDAFLSTCLEPRILWICGSQCQHERYCKPPHPASDLLLLLPQSHSTVTRSSQAATPQPPYRTSDAIASTATGHCKANRRTSCHYSET